MRNKVVHTEHPDRDVPCTNAASSGVTDNVRPNGQVTARAYDQDNRAVLTLDAGGTKLSFAAIRGQKTVGKPIVLPANAATLDEFLDKLTDGFTRIAGRLDHPATAISFSFPGPADYSRGIIGSLENLPVFRGGVALGPMLEDHFQLPVFINNDGDLFTLGEATAGFLPLVNDLLAEAGSERYFTNLFGTTFGTGFGGGIVHDGRLFRGDNSAGGEINRMRNKLMPTSSVEESVSAAGVRRVYAREAALRAEETPSSEDIFEIGMGRASGDKKAALQAFDELATVAGDALANAITLVDGLVVVGGGLAQAHPLFLARLVEEMNAPYTTQRGGRLDRFESRAFNLEDLDERAAFLHAAHEQVPVPRSSRSVAHDPVRRIGVGLTRLGTSPATATGAYVYALQRLDEEAYRPRAGSVAHHRPWGYFLVLEDSPGYRVKRIVVRPGSRLSLQRHAHRSEHWRLVEGEALVTLGARESRLRSGESVDVAPGELHRLANPGPGPMVLIEVQEGDYFGEDDIERLEDDFGRA